MRKEYGVGLVFVLFLLSFAQVFADEFDTKAIYRPNNTLIQQIAKDLAKETDLQTAESIWNWMSTNIEYGKNDTGGIENIIKVGRGQCSDQACVAASLLLASGLSADKVRVGAGNGHMWVEIFIDRWHRFDTVYSQVHSFEIEYSLPIYEEGKDYFKIDYYYYDTRVPAKLILDNTETKLYKDVHVIELTLFNEGEMKRVIKPEIITNLEITGTSSESIEIDPSDTFNFKIYLKGEGHVRIEIDEIIFEADLKYPQKENHEQNITSTTEITPQEDSQVEESVKAKENQNKVEIKKISLPKSSEAEKIRIINTSTQKESNSLPIFITLITLITIPVFISIRRFIL